MEYDEPRAIGSIQRATAAYNRVFRPEIRWLCTTASSNSGPSDELVTAIDWYGLGDLSLGRAAKAAGLSRWEIETVLKDAGFTSPYGPRIDDQLQREIDVSLDLDE